MQENLKLNSKKKGGVNGEDIDAKRRKMKEERRKTQVNKVKYDNCKILDENGRHIFNCDEKKAIWYLGKGYGIKLSTDPDPLVVQFTFSNPEEEQMFKFEGCEELYKPEFYLQERENICACCGATKEFARFQTVPHLYRLNFPHNIKSHTSTDIVLLCQPCHDVASRLQDRLKVALAESFGFSLSEKSVQLNLSNKINQLFSIAQILKSDGLPEMKRQ